MDFWYSLSIENDLWREHCIQQVDHHPLCKERMEYGRTPPNSCLDYWRSACYFHALDLAKSRGDIGDVQGLEKYAFYCMKSAGLNRPDEQNANKHC